MEKLHEIIFTRHGKTEWNQQKRFQGMTGDSPLLPTSYDEIKQLGQYLQDIPFEKFILVRYYVPKILRGEFNKN